MNNRPSDQQPPQLPKVSPDQSPGALTNPQTSQTTITDLERSQRQVARLEAMLALFLEVVAQHIPDQVIDRALELTVRVLEAKCSVYWVISENTYLLSSVRGDSDVPIGTTIPQGSGLTGQVFTSGQSLLVEDYQNANVRLPDHGNAWRSMILAPVKRGETVIGVLVISNNSRPGVFDHADLLILEQLAAVCAISLENARLLTSATRANNVSRLRDEQHQAVRTLSLEVMAQREPQRVITQALETVMGLVGAEVGGFWRSHGRGQSIELMVTLGPTQVKPGITMPWGSGAAGVVIASDQALFIDDYQNWLERNPEFSSMLRSVMSIPIRREHEVLGAMIVARNTNLQNFNTTDLELFELFATPVALALDNAHLLEVSREAERNSRRRAEISGAINTLSFELTAALEPKAMLERILRQATALFGGDMGGVFLYQGHAELEVVTRFGEGWLAQPRIGKGATGRAVETGQSVLVENYPTWEHRVENIGLKWKSAISAPLRRADTVLGAITLADTQQPGRYSSLDLFGLERFAALASIALENVRLFESEQRQTRDERIRSNISNALVRLRTVTELCQAVVQEVAVSLAYTHVCVMQLEVDASKPGEPEQQLRVQAQVGYRQLPKFLPLQDSFSGQVARGKQALFIANTFDQTGNQIVEYQRYDPELVSAIGVPLLGRDGVLGTLVVESAGTPKLTITDLEMLVSLAAPISVAFENATLHESLEARARELERLSRETHYAATHDTLTGLPNRRAFEMDATKLLQQQQLKQEPFCLVVIDLVGFKAVNDNFGHAAGDEALKMIAQTLRIIASHQLQTMMQSSSGDDVLAYRVGGDEFFLLIESNRANAFELVKQIIATVQGLEFGVGLELQVTPNVGLAEFPTDAPDLDNLLTLADTRMYTAKRAGKPVLEPDELEHPPVPRRRKEDAGH
jgi:diguanylate cyclase (GGDEF)-like protein